MKDYIEERVINVAKYIIDEKATVRKAGAKFGISKSTIHNDMQMKLPKLDSALASEVHEILQTNKKERHIRGGQATKEKYKNKTEKK